MYKRTKEVGNQERDKRENMRLNENVMIPSSSSLILALSSIRMSVTTFSCSFEEICKIEQIITLNIGFHEIIIILKNTTTWFCNYTAGIAKRKKKCRVHVNELIQKLRDV